MSRETERAALEEFLLREPAVQVYAIGDLDPTCWGDCTWEGLRNGGGGGSLQAVGLTYRGLAVPVLQLLAPPAAAAQVAAARSLLELLVGSPERLPGGEWEAHLNSEFCEVRAWRPRQMARPNWATGSPGTDPGTGRNATGASRGRI